MIKVFFIFSESNNSFGVNQVGNILNHELKKYCLIINNFSTLEFIKTQKNILHIHGCWSLKIFFYFLLAKILGKKIILSPHGMLDPYSFTQKFLKKKIAWLLFQKYIVKNSNIIIVNSNLEKKNVKRLVKNKKVYVVPHGIYKIDYLKKRTVNKDTRFVFFSRIHPVKNLKKLVEIWVNNKFFDNKVLDIYGDISDKDYFYQINKIILNKKNIFYKGALYKKKTLTLSKYDVFLFPSISENFGLVILEALSAGLYLIINQTLPWKKLEKKKFATISNFRTNNLINAIKFSQRKISSKNRKKKIMRFLNAYYSWNKISKLYFNIYKKVRT